MSNNLNKYDDLVPYQTICGCTHCSCSQGCKLVPNPAKYDYNTTKVTLKIKNKNE